MKPRILATVAILATTLLANLGAVKAAQPNHLAGAPVATELGASQNSNYGGGSDKSAVMLLLAGVLVGIGATASRASSDRGGRGVEVLAVPLNPSDSSSYIKRAYAHLKQGDRLKAIEQFNEAIYLDPHSAYLYSERANFRQNQLGDKHGAIEDYTKAIRLSPQNAIFYFWRSQLHHALGNDPRAIEDYNEAIRLAPEETIYYCFESSVNLRKR